MELDSSPSPKELDSKPPESPKKAAPASENLT